MRTNRKGYYYNVDNKNNYQLRKSPIGGVYACLVIHAKVIWIRTFKQDKMVNVYSSACSRNVKRDKKQLFKSCIQSAKIQGFAIMRGESVETTAGNFRSYDYALSNRLTVDIIDYRYRYFTRNLNIKRVNRKGKYYNYVFDKKTGQIKTYTKTKYVKNIRKFSYK